ncbi:MAG: 50S ribosomal protein L29 [Vicinamibacterales bacterium]|jgi:large subunit ribosomal protein L29|nr:50S ribosomal protein L29 [Acidobacteriota bacterium]MDP6373623.1 50S ribosomal protein L29 [Vicinamibacterales bacterium]MDP6609078.1 50S ribosomal protein L29 [Vicinamibacterales bacterium]HAK54427.1 50S ribosomal protein L29 [Acidobacteriota bacterium]|tara:strand:- start:2737 stop:2973 length:237 start_codon:yes stop_codon:yes gene_type:complete
MTKVSEFRDLSDDNLRQRELELDDEVFRLRIQKSMGQLDSPRKLRETRRDLARVKTVLREHEGDPGAAAGEAGDAADE